MNRFNVRLIAAFAAVYIIWGSTYLAIHFAIETMPPLLMAGVRFLIAGALMYGVLRARGAVAPTRANWKAAAIVGGLLLLVGNGALVWGEQYVPSGLAALLIATVPLWMVLLHWLARGPRPTGQVAVGLGLGLVGILVLVGPSGLTTSSASLLAMVLILVGSLAWAAGSVYARNAPLPASPLMGTALEMLAGGAMLVIVGSLMGEWSALDTAAISLRSLLAMGYLIIFGSLVAFSAYVWLIQVATPAQVATYAYVNPVVAVLLGWAFAGEALTRSMMVAAAIIVAAVVLITLPKRTRVGRPRGGTATLAPVASMPGEGA